MGGYDRDYVYRQVMGRESFEPVLSRIEQINHNALWKLALEIPQEWYQYDAGALSNLIEMLYERRLFVRELITDFRNSPRKPFPNSGRLNNAMLWIVRLWRPTRHLLSN